MAVERVLYLLQGTALNYWRLAAAAAIRGIPMGAVHQLAAAAWAETPSVFSSDAITRRVIVTAAPPPNYLPWIFWSPLK